MRRMRLSLIALVALVAPGHSLGAIAPPRAARPIAFHAHAPPPRWPVHGHRHLHPSGAVLCFDANLGVYSVIGAAYLYFFDEGFLRFATGRWEGSGDPFGPWQPVPAEWVPLRLRVEHYVSESPP